MYFSVKFNQVQVIHGKIWLEILVDLVDCVFEEVVSREVKCGFRQVDFLSESALRNPPTGIKREWNKSVTLKITLLLSDVTTYEIVRRIFIQLLPINIFNFIFIFIQRISCQWHHEEVGILSMPTFSYTYWKQYWNSCNFPSSNKFYMKLSN